VSSFTLDTVLTMFSRMDLYVCNKSDKKNVYSFLSFYKQATHIMRYLTDYTKLLNVVWSVTLYVEIEYSVGKWSHIVQR